ncbi:MAG: hypothetical protein ACO20H_13825, partial [Bacteriovoracaceae bacterium]
MKKVIGFLLIFSLYSTSTHAWGFKSFTRSIKKAAKKVARETKKVVKKAVHKPAKLATEIYTLPTVAIATAIVKPKETIKDPLKTIGKANGDVSDLSTRVTNDTVNFGLDRVGDVGEGVEDVAEPLADNVNIGGGVNVDSNGNTNLTDGDGNIVPERPTDPNDLKDPSFDWESAIALARKDEVNDFIKAEA